VEENTEGVAVLAMNVKQVHSCNVTIEATFYHNVGQLGFPDVCARCGGGAKLLKGQREGQEQLYKTVRPLCSDPTCITAGWVTRAQIQNPDADTSVNNDVIDIIVPDYFPIKVARRGRKGRGGLDDGKFDNGHCHDNHRQRWTQEQLDQVLWIQRPVISYICLQPTAVGECLINGDSCDYRKQHPDAESENEECGTVFHEQCYASKWHFSAADVNIISDSDSDSEAQAKKKPKRARKAVRRLS
jgi:hypothetical protein